MSGRPAPVLVVVYARDVEVVARFYSTVLGLPVLERASQAVVVGDAALEIAVVRAAEPAEPAEPTEPTEENARVEAPQASRAALRRREETPIKPSFRVEDLATATRAAAASGGGTKPLDAAWEWRGEWHLDGHDPEGNVVQFRASGAPR